jgi:hypothetical protein
MRLGKRAVDWGRNVLMIERTGRRDSPRRKTRRSRRVGMRPVVRETLLTLWHRRNRPQTGPVFLNKYGRPYADTGEVGGNPLASAHGLPAGRPGSKASASTTGEPTSPSGSSRTAGTCVPCARSRAGPRCGWSADTPCSSSPTSTS